MYYKNLVHPHTYLYLTSDDNGNQYYIISEIPWYYSNGSSEADYNINFNGKSIKINNPCLTISFSLRYYEKTSQSSSYFGKLHNIGEPISATYANSGHYQIKCDDDNKTYESYNGTTKNTPYPFIFLRINFNYSTPSEKYIDLLLLGITDSTENYNGYYNKVNVNNYYGISFDIKKNSNNQIDEIQNLTCIILSKNEVSSTTYNVLTWNDVYSRLVPTSEFLILSPGSQYENFEFIKALRKNDYPGIELEYMGVPVEIPSKTIFTNIIMDYELYADGEYRCILNNYLSLNYDSSLYVRYADINTDILKLSTNII